MQQIIIIVCGILNEFSKKSSLISSIVWRYLKKNNAFYFLFTGTGYLYCGDVGDSDTEEINLIKSGKNYGWNIFEGSIAKINRTKNETIGILVY